MTAPSTPSGAGPERCPTCGTDKPGLPWFIDTGTTKAHAAHGVASGRAWSLCPDAFHTPPPAATREDAPRTRLGTHWFHGDDGRHYTGDFREDRDAFDFALGLAVATGVRVRVNVGLEGGFAWRGLGHANADGTIEWRGEGSPPLASALRVVADSEWGTASRPFSTRGETAGAGLRDAAEALAADLFTDGRGRRATRLAMEFDDGKPDGTGWGERAIVSRIETHLRAFAAPVPPQGAKDAEPVCYTIKSGTGEYDAIRWTAAEAHEEVERLNSDEYGHDEQKVRQRRPFSVVPLYTAPPAASPDSEVEKARRAFCEAARAHKAAEARCETDLNDRNRAALEAAFDAKDRAYDALLAAEKAAAERAATNNKE